MRPLGPAIPICVTSPSDEVTRLEEAARESERRYHDIQMQLAHANRVATMGYLSASIAHELNQPLSGVVVSAETPSGNVHVRVQDSGPGIDPANLERIFDAFYTTKANGLGMGLSICRSIIEAHGGKLWATTGMQHGASFQFTVPAVR
jgi:signal transduction histidine kinase